MLSTVILSAFIARVVFTNTTSSEDIATVSTGNIIAGSTAPNEATQWLNFAIAFFGFIAIVFKDSAEIALKAKALLKLAKDFINKFSKK